jgi:hypothetical protein
MTPLPVLPECRWRVTMADRSHLCDSPLVKVLGTSVSDRTCSRCVMADAVPKHVQETKEPSWWEKAMNWLAAHADHAVAGMPLVSRQVLENRLAACQRCEYRVGPRQGPFKCKLCGCPDMADKASMARQECPHPEGSRWSPRVA